MTYYNTTHIDQADKADATDRAKKQEQAILAYFKERGISLTPWQVHYRFPDWPITSVRRAITNLTAAGKLVKTADRRKGPMGKLSYCWRVRQDKPNQQSLF